jgi:pulcherriminic acid synthase
LTFTVVAGAEEVPTGGYRSYEVFQRERVGESLGVFPPRALISADYLTDPAGVTATLREAFTCYRDWVGNSFWVCRYDDVTSVFADDANFETRPKRWWASAGLSPQLLAGRDLRHFDAVRHVWVRRVDDLTRPVAAGLIQELRANGGGDLALDVAARFPVGLLAGVLGLPADQLSEFASAYLALQRGIEPDAQAPVRTRDAVDRLLQILVPLLDDRRKEPGEDLLSTLAHLPVDGPAVSAVDVVVTLLEEDHQTVHGALANLWYLLLTHPDQLAEVGEDRRLVKSAYLEAIRHSPPVVAAGRFARHEVERFGRLLPKGALVMCSAAAANRDPRVFSEPDRFWVARKDLCQREPRGQYRADGLATGISFGTGRPSVYPAQPEDRPRSPYAVTRDVVVTVTNLLLDAAPAIRLAPGPAPSLRALRIGGMHTCWALPVEFRAG